MNTENFQYTLEFQVRDYECDFQGIVNNSVYLNYLEHTRHEFAKHLGLDIVALAHKGINLVVIKAELNYKKSLRSGDAFVVGLNMERVLRVRLGFQYTIYIPGTETVILQAEMLLTPVNERGRPFWPDEIQAIFE